MEETIGAKVFLNESTGKVLDNRRRMGDPCFHEAAIVSAMVLNEESWRAVERIERAFALSFGSRHHWSINLFFFEEPSVVMKVL